MLPFPKELQKQYPTPPLPSNPLEPHPWTERPWWRFPEKVKGDPESTYKVIGVRTDGVKLVQDRKVTIHCEGLPYGISVPKVPIQRSWQAARETAAALVDKHAPIAHPGFRVGQVWAQVSLLGYPMEVLMIVGNDTTLSLTTGDPGPWVLSTFPYTVTTERLLLYLKTAFLLSDPCCPWRAPWASPGEAADLDKIKAAIQREDKEGAPFVDPERMGQTLEALPIDPEADRRSGELLAKKTATWTSRTLTRKPQ